MTGTTEGRELNDFGVRLSAQRIGAGMSQQELATRAGVSVRAVRNIEQGRAQARPGTARRLAEAVGLIDTEPSRPRIGVLGPLTIHIGHTSARIGPAKQRLLLGLLALQPNRLVDRAEIVDVLWGEQPPASHVNLVHTYVRRLRELLGGPSAGLITAVRNGYLLTADAERIDVLRFDELVARAEEVKTSEPKTALDLLAQALGCWRGPVLEDTGPALRQHPAAVKLGDRRLAAAIACADLAVELGEYQVVAEHLRVLSREEPLHEGLHSRLMLVMAGLGEQSAALELFTLIRHRLADELGIEPGPALQDAHLRVLRQQLTEPRPRAASPPVPAQLPVNAAGFIGRATYLEQLDALSSDRDGESMITLITGTAGVGKTALAVHWARQARERFPDGQLYVDLRGYGPENPVSPADALSEFLRALGVEGAHVPPEIAERAARFRTLVDGRRILILLDNARTAEQVRPLLPGTSSCLVIITSRDTLPGLVARDGARRLQLDLFSAGEALALLRSLVGERVDAEPEAAGALAARCVRLPLALRLAAELTAHRPATRLTQLVDELADEQHQLDTLDAGGDTDTALRAVFSWSYQQLPPETARAFRLLGLHPGLDIDHHAVAALTGTGLAAARRLINELARAHLIEYTEDGRLRLHDLLRIYAAELAAQIDGEPGVRDALSGLLGHYQHTAAEAMKVLVPVESLRRPEVPASSAPTPAFHSADQAMAWLQTERGNLVATARLPGFPRYAGNLSGILFRFLDIGDHYDDAQSLHGFALTASAQDGYVLGEVYALRGLAGVCRWQGRFEEALSYSKRAAEMAERTGDQLLIAGTLNNAALVHWRMGQHAEAVRTYRRALGRELPDRPTEARLRNNLGAALHQLGEHAEAIEHHRFAISVAEETGDQDLLGYALADIGQVYLELGDCAAAAEHHRRALAVADDTGDRTFAGVVLNGLGEIAQRIGDADAALDHFSRAVALTGLTGHRYEEARAHEGLARAYDDLGARAEAQPHWDAALVIYTELNVPDAERLRSVRP